LVDTINIRPEVELNQFFYLNGTGTQGWSHYFYLKPVMYRIDCFYSHTPSSIKEYKDKIDNNVSFYNSEARGLSSNLPYPQLDNNNIYDALYNYSSWELEWDYIQNQFYDTVLNNKYFDFWGTGLDYQPKDKEIFGGSHWRLIVDVTLDGKRKHKEITGYSSYPEGFAFFESILTDFNNNAQSIHISQNIEKTHSDQQIKEKSFIKRFLSIIIQKD
jgi:hypothetical protein